MIVIDASAVIAVLFEEELSKALQYRMMADTERLMSVASYLEAGTVLAGRAVPEKRLRAIQYLDAFIDEAGIILTPVDTEQIRVALRARIMFGRGMGHGGVLNFGDSFSYALAKTMDAPLLFIGDDFTKTDIVSALA